MKPLTGNSIQFYYLMGRVLAKYPEEMKEDVVAALLPWFSRYRNPWFRGKRRLGMIQNTSILTPDMK